MKSMNTLFKKYLANYSELSKQCWQSICLTFIESLATGICFFLSLYFVNILHISIANTGLLLSLYGVGTIFGGILAGKLSDHLSTKTISIASLLMQSIAFFLFTQLKDKNLLMLNMFIIGLCTYGFMTANNVWMLKQCQNNGEMRLKSINIARAASNLGMGVSGIMIGILDVNQFHALFYFSSITLIFSSIYLNFFVVDTQLFAIQKNISSDINLEIKKYHNKKIIFLMLLCLFLIGLIISQLSVTYPVYIQHTFPQMGASAVSILFILDTLLIVFFQAPLVNCLKNFNKIFLAGIGAFLMGFGMFILNFSFMFYTAIISCLIWTTGEMIFIAMAQFVCYECGVKKKKGQIMGFFQAISASSRVVGPVAGGFIYYHFGGNMLWFLSMIIGATCLFLCSWFKKYDYTLIANTDTSASKGAITSKPSFS